MVTNKEVDIAIIGTGSAGMSAYSQAKKITSSIAIIEGDQYGTTCARVGCMPSKLLIAAADASYHIDQAKDFGIHVSGKQINSKEVMKRVREERDRFVSFVLKSVEAYDPSHKIKAKAQFKDRNTLELSNGDTITAKAIIIAVGSRPEIPEVFQTAGDRLITSDDLFYFEELPKSIAVIGTGIIGLELGQALHRLGVETTIFGRSAKVGKSSDPKIAEASVSIFSEELNLELNSKIQKVTKENQSATITYTDSQGKAQEKSFEYILVATGRTSNIDTLKIENTGLELNEAGIPKFNMKSCQCHDSNIFIAGDANDTIPLLHEVSDEGRIAGTNAATYPEVKEFQRKTPLTITFSDPQIMSIGSNYKELTEQGIDFAIGEVDFADQGRSRVFLVNKGLLRIYAEKKTGKLLGAEMIGPVAEHLGHLLAWAHQAELTIDELLANPFYHPTIEEGLRTALRDLKAKL